MKFVDRILFLSFLVSISEVSVVSLINFSSSCSTLSCITDENELSDRIGTQALTLQVPATLYVWLEKMRVPSFVAWVDVILLATISIVSDDVSSLAHVWIALAFVSFRLVGSLQVRYDSISALQYACLFSLRTLVSVFSFGHACTSVIDFCKPVGWRWPLPPLGVLLSELGFFLFGTLFFALNIREDKAWYGGRELFYSFGISVSLILIRAVMNPLSSSLLLILAGFDLSLCLRYRKESADWKSPSTLARFSILTVCLSFPTVLSFF